jgi:hypothetical protein
MPKTNQTTSIRRFNPRATREERALQAWLILTSAARFHQTLTYAELGELMFNGRRGAGVLAAILGHVAFYCEDHDLPPLNALVVRTDTGESGDGVPRGGSRVRASVFRFRWYDLHPPAPRALRASFERHT